MIDKLVIAEANRVFDVNVHSKTRKRKVVYTRFIVSRILRERGYTLKKIGSVLNLDHSSIIHSLKQFKILYKYDDFKEMCELIDYPLLKFIPVKKVLKSNDYCLPCKTLQPKYNRIF